MREHEDDIPTIPSQDPPEPTMAELLMEMRALNANLKVTNNGIHALNARIATLESTYAEWPGLVERVAELERWMREHRGQHDSDRRIPVAPRQDGE